jgi:hypothetical protein
MLQKTGAFVNPPDKITLSLSIKQTPSEKWSKNIAEILMLYCIF